MFQPVNGQQSELITKLIERANARNLDDEQTLYFVKRELGFIKGNEKQHGRITNPNLMLYIKTIIANKTIYKHEIIFLTEFVLQEHLLDSHHFLMQPQPYPFLSVLQLDLYL